ncbi:hypothetical protein [Mesorhizobium sp. M1273]|uniref:hypothetical protein n=1 Tax=Mesorhizobium sp. M1273 TaxID=2957075 RepID=UPI0033376372
MIPLGIIASQAASAGGGSLPPGATAFIDIKNGFYYSGGAERSVSDVMTGYDPSALTASGLFYDFNNLSNCPFAAGPLLSDFASALAAGCTIVFDLNQINPPYGFLMFLGDDVDYDASVNGISIEADWHTSDFGDVLIGNTDGLGSTGNHKLAVTLNRDVGGGNYEYAWSLDGGAADTQTVNYAASWTLATVAIGNDGTTDELLDNAYLRSITLYPAKLPADLPALTT